MAKTILAEVYLCMRPYNGILTDIEVRKAKYMDQEGKGLYLKELKGQKEWSFNAEYAFKIRKEGKQIIQAYYDRESGLQLKPSEIISGEAFSRIDIRNAISSAFDARDKLKQRYNMNRDQKIITSALVVFLIAGLIFIVALVIASNVHVTVNVLNNTVGTATTTVLQHLGNASKGIS